MQSGVTRVVIVVTPYVSALRASYPRVVNCLNSTLTGLKEQVKESRRCPPTRNPTATPYSGTPVSQETLNGLSRCSCMALIAIAIGLRTPQSFCRLSATGVSGPTWPADLRWDKPRRRSFAASFARRGAQGSAWWSY